MSLRYSCLKGMASRGKGHSSCRCKVVLTNALLGLEKVRFAGILQLFFGVLDYLGSFTWEEI